jgi:hypothetical protein
MDYKPGQSVTYKILDEESYSRGYGIHYEIKTSVIREIRYVMENGDTITLRNIQAAEAKEPKNESPK